MLQRRLGECSTHVLRAARGSSVPRAARRVALTSPVAPTPAHRYTSSATAPSQNGADTRIVSSDVFDRQPSTAFLKARLVAALNPPPRPEGGRDPVDAATVLSAAQPLLSPQHRTILEPYLLKLSASLSTHYIANPCRTDQLEVIANTLATCALNPRSVAVQKARSRDSIHAIVGRYADWLAAEARHKPADSARSSLLLEVYERQLRALGAEGSGEVKLPLPFVAAWAMLRVGAGKTGAPDPPVTGLTIPFAGSVLGHAVKQYGASSSDKVLREAIGALCGSASDAGLPATPEALETRLRRLRSRNDAAGVHRLWTEFTAEVDKPASEHPLAGKDARAEALARFLNATRSKTTSVLSEEAKRTLADIETDVLARLPKPWPLPVLHTLLQTVGNGKDDASAPDFEGNDPNKAAGKQLKDRVAVLESLHKIWETARSQGVVRDTRAYSLYMGILGRYHDSAALFAAWDELVGDAACRALHEQTEGKGPWPTTLILNQTLSSAFFIGSSASDLGMALFHSAVAPSSPVKADLFTINTALRYAAHCGDVTGMNTILGTAQRLSLSPDIVTYTSLVQGLLRAQRPDLAKAALDAMRGRGIAPNERMASMLVADLAAPGSSDGLKRAEEMVRDMRARGIRTTVPMWTALIAGYFRGGWVVDGWSALARMRTQGLRLNDLGYNIVLRQASLAGTSTAEVGVRGDAAAPAVIELFRDMVRERVVPTADTYAVALGGLVNARRAEDVAEVLAEMDRRGFRTNKGSLGRTIEAARRLVAGRR